MASNTEKDNAKTVEDHYNNLKEGSLKERGQSRIFYMRNFNNWMKSQLISMYLNKIRENKKSKIINVLDLCSGKGGDQLKWRKGGVEHVIFADIANESVRQSEQRYKEMKSRMTLERHNNHPIYTAEFITADCGKELLTEFYKENVLLDLSSCQFSLHYSFESYKQAETMIRNACERLRPKGYFIGTTTDAYEIMKRLRESKKETNTNSFGNSVYRVTFEEDFDPEETPPLFGTKYNFHLEGVVDCPEFLVYFDTLVKIAEQYDMKLVMKETFANFFKEQIETKEGRTLIGRMQGLETFPAPEGETLVGDLEKDYDVTKKESEALGDEGLKEDLTEYEMTRKISLGTLSSPEWEACKLYLLFAFQKKETALKPQNFK